MKINLILSGLIFGLDFSLIQKRKYYISEYCQ